MLTLALDTASAACQACVYDDGRTLGACVEMIGRGHAERLMPVIDNALDEAGIAIATIGRVAVTVGPGSFTGIRVGVATARALALALGCDCVGVGSLRALAAAHLPAASPVLAAIDARRGEVYAALFDGDGHETFAPAVMIPEDAARLAEGAAARLTGSGAPLVAAHLGSRPEIVLSDSDTVDIAAMAHLAAAQEGPFDRPKPLYLRGADAKPQAGFAVARKA